MRLLSFDPWIRSIPRLFDLNIVRLGAKEIRLLTDLRVGHGYGLLGQFLLAVGGLD